MKNYKQMLLLAIAALEQACPERPMTQDEQGGCVWCGVFPSYKDWKKLGVPAKHYEDCGWRIGRERLASLKAELESA